MAAASSTARTQQQVAPRCAPPTGAGAVGDINRRILLIDDTRSIHEDFAKILAAPAADDLADTEALLFGGSRRADAGFELASAFQGQEGLARLDAALAEGRPYAMAFVDMRMPPGWDGMETAERLWQRDPRLQVVICTAYSDHSWDEVLERVAAEDRLLILKKPFDLIEVAQLARSLTAKWSLARQAQAQQDALERMVGELGAAELRLRSAIRDLDVFALSVAGALHGPLGRVQAFGELLAEAVAPGGGKPAHYLDRIRANAANAEGLVRGILDLAEVAHARPEPEVVDLGAMAERLFAGLRKGAPDREAQLRVAPGLLARGDPRLLQRALLHLLEQCWRFTAARDAARIELGMAERGDTEAVFFLRDNGCGFDAAHAGGLFERYVQIHSNADDGASGIGLVTAGRIVQRHGGRIWAESAPDQGTTFFFTLPLPQAGGATC